MATSYSCFHNCESDSHVTSWFDLICWTDIIWPRKPFLQSGRWLSLGQGFYFMCLYGYIVGILSLSLFPAHYWFNKIRLRDRVNPSYFGFLKIFACSLYPCSCFIYLMPLPCVKTWNQPHQWVNGYCRLDRLVLWQVDAKRKNQWQHAWQLSYVKRVKQWIIMAYNSYNDSKWW